MVKVDFKTYRTQDMENKLNIMGARPIDVMLTGVTGAGKSTTINAFFEKMVADVGDGVDPETMELDAYSLNDFFRIWDTPGLGDGVIQDKIHKKKIIDLLYKTYEFENRVYGFIDLCMVIVEGANRDMGSTYTLLNDVIVPNIQTDRIIVLINQADVAMKGYHWNKKKKEPDEQLTKYLDEQAKSIKKRVKEATGLSIKMPISFSAEYGWNVKAVMDRIIDSIPTERRKLMG